MWTDLRAHFEATKDRRFETLVDGDRAENFSVVAGDMRLDYAKTNIDPAARDLLIALLDATGVADKRADMFGGSPRTCAAARSKGRVARSLMSSISGLAGLIWGLRWL